MIKRAIYLFVAILFFYSTFAVAEQTDLVLKNGVITTLEKDQPTATALAVRGDRIVWIGDTDQASEWIGEKTKVLDLKGAFAYPGLIESHAHIVNLGSSRVTIDLVGTPTLDAVLDKVRERASQSEKGAWVQGHGWDQNDWPVKQFPSASDLDRVAPDNPVVLERIDGHAYWVNSAAMKKAGITAASKDPEGGKIRRDDTGNPTGILVDNAMEAIHSAMGELSVEVTMKRTQIALEEAARKGITMVQDAGSSGRDLEAFRALAKRNELPVRVYSMVYMPTRFGEAFLKTGPQNYGPYLDVRSVKIVADGAMGSRGAAMLEPYTDDPGNSGLVIWKEPDLLKVLEQAKASGIQMCIHAIGDRTNRMVLDAYEKIGVKGLRWRIEHAQLLNPQDIPRFAQLDVIASMQPIHATSDMPWFADRVGPERTKNGSYVWRSLLNHNTLIAAGSDAPVEDINPLWGLYAAITRTDHNGNPKGGWMPEQIVTREEALQMYTRNAAYAAFRENDLGTLKKGKLADIIVLPQNLMTCDPKALIDMKVQYTIVGGIIRHSP